MLVAGPRPWGINLSDDDLVNVLKALAETSRTSVDTFLPPPTRMSYRLRRQLT